MRLSCALVLLAAALLWPLGSAYADAPCSDSWAPSAAARTLDQALYMVKLAELLDLHASAEEAAVDAGERASVAKVADAKKLREQAKTRAEPDRAPILAKAELLDAQVLVTRVQSEQRKAAATESRRRAKEIRDEAVRMTLGRPEVKTSPDSCDPPFFWSPDGRKHYKPACM